MKVIYNIDSHQLFLTTFQSLREAIANGGLGIKK
jgi:hypothetical protein